jgi:SAM-dependent methyltransferase
MNYRLAYAIGFHPWEGFADHPPFADTLTRLVAAEENGGGPPFGPVLDVGTGSGVWAVRLAERGWRVTGVDLVERALKRAHERVVTALEGSGVGSGYRLVLDTGTFHGLDQAGRRAMAREVSAIAADDATVILDCFAPRRRGPLPRGAGPEEIEAAFEGWTVTAVAVADSDPDLISRLGKFNERFYRLRRAGAP